MGERRARVGDFVAADGVGEGGDEGQEGFAGGGVDEAGGVGRGGDAFDRGDEVVRKGEGWGRLGLRDGGEDDGLLVRAGGDFRG